MDGGMNKQFEENLQTQRVRVTIPIDWDDIIEKFIDPISQSEQNNGGSAPKKQNTNSTNGGAMHNTTMNNGTTGAADLNDDSDSDY